MKKACAEGVKMPVYVDNVRIKWRGKEWCHLVADNLEELHEFAKGVGLKRSWYQSSASYPHYDVTVSTRALALRLGARVGCRKTVIQCGKKLKAEQGEALIEKKQAPRQLGLFI
tara:strand:- start:5178 stop:5519 length:342 start_codon:yes stop_codon:yes gene_type:complete